jgi:acyl-coenzyme A synthetase/AMP-(fatty) acid ligase
VIGVPDDILGEAVKAFVVPRSLSGNGLRDSLYDFCKKRIAPQLVPKEIILLQALPKNSAGKVLKQSLKVM